jgi:hypothetical protein
VDARSRAEGVTIVRVLIKIFSLRVMAMRTSFSLTKSGTLSAGPATEAGAAAVATAVDCLAAPLLAGLAGIAAADPEAEGCPWDSRSKIALTAEVATSAALGLGATGGAAGPAIAAPRGIPRALRTFSTMLAIKRRSGMTVGFPLALAAEAFAAAACGGCAEADMR